MWFCSITFRPWEDGCCKSMEGSVKAIKRQDSAERPAVPGLQEEGGKEEILQQRGETREEKKILRHRFSPLDGSYKPRHPKRCCRCSCAGVSLAKPSQDPSLTVWGAEEMGSPEMRGVSASGCVQRIPSLKAGLFYPVHAESRHKAGSS